MGENHWKEVPFEGLISKIESGSRPKGGVKGISEGIPSIGAEHLTSDGDFNFSNLRHVPESFAKKMNRGVLQKDDVLIVKDGATTGKVSYVSDSFPYSFACLNEHVFLLRFKQDVVSKFMFYFLRCQIGQEMIMSAFHGGAQGGINSRFVENITVPLPPLAEQKRIVEKLDAILPRVKKVRERLERIPGIVKKFRQSVLAAACSGELTAGWREKETGRPGDKENGGLGDLGLGGWKRVTIKELSVSMSTGPFGSMLHSSDYIKNGIPVINPTNITSDLIIPDYSNTISDVKALELSRYRLRLNDILLSRRGDLSKCGIVTEKEVNWIAGTGLFILRAKIDPKYFKFFFSQDSVQEILNSQSIGSTMLNLNQTILGKIEIDCPPLTEQSEIVRRVERLFALADSIEARYKKAVARVEMIEQSVLSKAFRGELEEADTDDEQAGVLRGRIMNSREAWKRGGRGSVKV